LEVKYPAGYTRLPNLEVHFIHLKLRFIHITHLAALIHSRMYKNCKYLIKKFETDNLHEILREVMPIILM
jgi:hypothetical protein